MSSKWIKHIILSCSLIAIAVGYFYNQSDGLIIGVDHDRGKIYSNALQSSGGDDGSIMAIGFLSFGLSVIASLLAHTNVLSIKKLSAVYFVKFFGASLYRLFGKLGCVGFRFDKIW